MTFTESNRIQKQKINIKSNLKSSKRLTSKSLKLLVKRNTNLNDVGGAALFLLSNLSSGTTGEILHVDSGYHVVGMKSPDAPDISVV